jgi:hypothetical protein
MQRTTLPEQDMIARLAGQVGSGTFEAHVTVEASDLVDRERFRAVCEELGVKCVLIELPAGARRSQPMTSTYHRGDLAVVVEEVAELAGALRQRGFAATRVKLEAVITNTGVPASDDEARAFPAGNYFEFHVKAALPADADLEPLRAICQRHTAHLSSNALKRDEDGRSERFVTQRVYGVGRQSAEAVFERLIQDLQAGGYTLSNRLREYTIYDSNIAVDAGWIDAPPGVGAAGGDEHD